MAGDLSLWMTAGRDLVQQSWTNVTFGAQLCGILSDLSWGGWKLLEFPHMVQHLPNLVDYDAIRGLRLLAALHGAQRVKDVPTAWLLRLEEWILKRFEDCTVTPDKVRCRLDEVAFVNDEANRLKNFNMSSRSTTSFRALCLSHVVLSTM
jgi:U3 small nucleolar RNA-associated protein 20